MTNTPLQDIQQFQTDAEIFDAWLHNAAGQTVDFSGGAGTDIRPTLATLVANIEALVGAPNLAALYTQDGTAHYSQFTIAQVLADPTPSNNGVWLKTGTGNGAGNWTWEANTLATFNTQIAALLKLRMPPQELSANVNAVRNRFTTNTDIGQSEGDRRSLAAWQVRTYRAQSVYNANVYSTFGESQALLISDANAAGGNGDPVGGYFISVADLATAGIVPGPTTYISAQVAIDIASAINQTLDETLNSANGQCSLVLRYAGVGATQELYYNMTAGDIWFLDANTPLYDNVVMTDPNYIGVYSSALVTTGNVKGYQWNKVWLPATYGGLALTGVILLVHGHATTAGQPTSIQACLASVISGNTIVGGQAYLNPDDAPAAFIPISNIVETLDVASADKVIVLADSLGLGGYNPPGKSWICRASEESDWNFENYSVSGQTYQTLLNYILVDYTNVNSFWFGQVSFRDYKGSRVLMMAEGNDAHWETATQFANDLKTAVKVCRDFGMLPTICSAYLNQAGYFSNGIQTLMRGIAEESGVDFLDLRRHGKLFAPVTKNGAEWQDPHPGVRFNGLHGDPVRKYLKGLDGPRKSFKIFRRRPTFVVASIDQLMVDDFYDRMSVFEEIKVGHEAMLTGAQHCDALTAQAGNWTIGNVESEYLALRSGMNVAFADYGLIEACFPEVPDEMRLVLNDPNITVWVKDVLTTPYPSTLNRYQAFTTAAGAPTVGATYTDGTNFPGVTFYYEGTWNGQQMFSANTNAQPYAGVSGKTAVGAGNLTLTSGAGPSPIAYTASNIGFDQQYYTRYGLPPGHWQQLTGSNGVFQLSALDLRSKVRRNKISFLLYEAGGFSLSAPRIMYRSGRTKAIEERKTYYRGQPEFRPARGTELLAHRYTNSMAGWTVTGALVPAAPGDAQMPNDPETGAVMVNCVTIDPNDYLSQAIGFAASYEDDQEIEVTVYARNYPALADPSPITADSYDYVQLEVDIVTNSGIVAPKIETVRLCWDELKFRTVLPLGDTAATIVLKPVGTANTIQLAYASVKLVNA